MASGALPEDLGSAAVRMFHCRSKACTRTRLTFFLRSSEIAYLLSHLMSVVERLEPAWRRAFLRRTRFMDADFQGDVLAVISTFLLLTVTPVH